MRVTKAVVPAAGLGTRFLPATKATPKEMLPVVDKPAIQYVVEEAASAGLTDVLMVTGRNKRPLEDHFDRNTELESALEAKGDLERLAAVRAANELATVHYVRQGDPLGLGHAVLMAEQHVGHEPFAVLLGDDLIDPRDPLLATMIDVRERLGGSVVALMEVPPEQIGLYGCAAVRVMPGEAAEVVEVVDLVEKPPPSEAPSNLAIIGRYVLDAAVFDQIKATPPGRGGEIQLTDALRTLATLDPASGGGVRGVVFRGRRYDTGDRLDFLKAVVRLASERPDLGPPFVAWLQEFVAAQPADQYAADGGVRPVRTVDEHLEACLSAIGPLEAIDLQLLDAHGSILAEEVVAPWSLPQFDNSSMDGYAVRAADVATATESAPVELPVTGDIPAGRPATLSMSPGTTMRIMTGAPIPQGADAVVPVEWTDSGLATVRVTRAPEAGAFVRRIGTDVVEGVTVLEAGTRLGPPQLGLLAAVGRDRVVCRPKPRVVVMATGSELVEPGLPLRSGQISESNSFALTTAAREAGALAFRVGIVPDDPRQLMDTIEDQLIRADLLVTTGGVSAGAYDVVKEVLSRLGTVSFDKVAMQPGMPQGFGVVGPDRTPIFTLPGNPVSAYVSFEVFVRPVIRRMLGVEPLMRPTVRAVCTDQLHSPEGKRQFARGWLSVEDGRYVVRPVGAQGSHLVNDLAHANCLLVVPESVTVVPAGGAVTVMVLERRLT